MIKKIIEYGIIAAAVGTLMKSPGCLNEMRYSGVPPAQGFPTNETVRKMDIERVVRNGALETYVMDGNTAMPVQAREKGLIIGDPGVECRLYSEQEWNTCSQAYKDERKKNGQGGVTEWVGEKVRGGLDTINNVIDGIMSIYRGSRGGNQNYQNNQNSQQR